MYFLFYIKTFQFFLQFKKNTIVSYVMLYDMCTR